MKKLSVLFLFVIFGASSGNLFAGETQQIHAKNVNTQQIQAKKVNTQRVQSKKVKLPEVIDLDWGIDSSESGGY